VIERSTLVVYIDERNPTGGEHLGVGGSPKLRRVSATRQGDVADDEEANGGRGSSGGGRNRRWRLLLAPAIVDAIGATPAKLGRGKWSRMLSRRRGGD
jgi:hypothetical protein